MRTLNHTLVIDDEYSSRIRPSSGRSGVKVEPSFRISTPHVSRDERPSLSQPRDEVPARNKAFTP